MTRITSDNRPIGYVARGDRIDLVVQYDTLNTDTGQQYMTYRTIKVTPSGEFAHSSMPKLTPPDGLVSLETPPDGLPEPNPFAYWLRGGLKAYLAELDTMPLYVKPKLTIVGRDGKRYCTVCGDTIVAIGAFMTMDECGVSEGHETKRWPETDACYTPTLTESQNQYKKAIMEWRQSLHERGR